MQKRQTIGAQLVAQNETGDWLKNAAEYKGQVRKIQRRRKKTSRPHHFLKKGQHSPPLKLGETLDSFADTILVESAGSRSTSIKQGRNRWKSRCEEREGARALADENCSRKFSACTLVEGGSCSSWSRKLSLYRPTTPKCHITKRQQPLLFCPSHRTAAFEPKRHMIQICSVYARQTRQCFQDFLSFSCTFPALRRRPSFRSPIRQKSSSYIYTKSHLAFSI